MTPGSSPFWDPCLPGRFGDVHDVPWDVPNFEGVGTEKSGGASISKLHGLTTTLAGDMLVLCVCIIFQLQC